MSYKIGQIMGSGNGYMTSVSCEARTIRRIGFGEQYIFEEFALAPTDGNFSSEKTYYLRFSVERFEDTSTITDKNMSLGIYLYTTDSETGKYAAGEQSTLATDIVVNSYTQERSKYFQYQIIFTPNSNSYKFLSIGITRDNYDHNHCKDQTYRQLVSGTHEGQDYKRTIYWGSDISDTQGDIYTINNLLNGKIAEKIGIQTKPGTLMQINGSSFKVGRTGTLEINNGILIKSVGIASPNDNANNFILDYAYED